jgi:hypothetical protein
LVNDDEEDTSDTAADDSPDHDGAGGRVGYDAGKRRY